MELKHAIIAALLATSPALAQTPPSTVNPNIPIAGTPVEQSGGALRQNFLATMSDINKLYGLGGGGGTFLFAASFPGPTAGDQISQCVAALPSTGGVCDARGLPSGGTIPAITLGQSGTTVLGPCGVFTLTGTIQVFNAAGVRGFKWQGCNSTSAPSGTYFIWGGNATDPAFRIRGVAYSEFRDFGIASNQFVPLSTAIQSETMTGPITTANRYLNLIINGTASGGLQKGFRWCIGDDCGSGGAGPDSNNDLNYINNVAVNNYTNCGFSMEGTQSVGHTFINSTMLANGVGARGVCTNQAANVNRNGGSFAWYGGGGGGHTVADFDIGGIGPKYIVNHADFENSNRLLQTQLGIAPVPISIEDVRWGANTPAVDGIIVNYQLGGPLIFSGNHITGTMLGVSPTIQIQTNPSVAGNSFMRGVAIGNNIVVPPSVAPNYNPFTAPSGASWTLLGNTVSDSTGRAFAVNDTTYASSVKPTGTGTCPITTQVGGNTRGTFTMSGACASGTVILTFTTTALAGWFCRANNRTTPAVLFNQTAASTVSATFTASGTTGAADVVGFDCGPY